MKQINFKTTKNDFNLIIEIVKRAKHELEITDTQSLSMDITAVHLNDIALDLPKLLNADLGNFGHDIFGIMRHINRRTGKLEDCFLPRCVKHDL